MPQPRQGRKESLMKLRSRHHLFVCTKADETETRTALEEDFRQNQGKDKRNYLVVVDDEDYLHRNPTKPSFIFKGNNEYYYN